MISLAAAKMIIERQVNQSRAKDDHQIVYPELTIHRDWGWVMFYGDEENYYVGERSAVKDTGAHPAYLINRVTGELTQAGKSWPIEKYIEDYETHLGSVQL